MLSVSMLWFPAEGGMAASQLGCVQLCLPAYLPAWLSCLFTPEPRLCNVFVLGVRVCLCVCLCARVHLSLYVCLSACLPTSLSVSVSLCLSLTLSVCLSVCLSVSLSVSLSLSLCLSLSLSLLLCVCVCVCVRACARARAHPCVQIGIETVHIHGSQRYVQVLPSGPTTCQLLSVSVSRL